MLVARPDVYLTKKTLQRLPFQDTLRVYQFFLIILCIALLAVPVSAATLTVAADGTGDYTTISSAISAASEGDTIYIRNGTYDLGGSTTYSISQNNLILRGENVDKVILQGTSDTIDITSTGCLIENIRFSGSGLSLQISGNSNIIRDNVLINPYAGIAVNSQNNVVTNNIILYPSGAGGGIPIAGSFNHIYDNYISGASGTSSSGSGARLTGNSTIFENNTIRDGVKYGLRISSGNNTIRNNAILNNANSAFYLYKTVGSNVIYQNSISGNGGLTAVYAPATAPSWNSTSLSEYNYSLNVTDQTTAYLGNWWGSSYTGTDEDGNGIADSGFTPLTSYGTDTAPLMGIWQDGTIYGSQDTIAPGAGFMADNVIGQAPFTVQFTEWSPGPGSVSTYAWDFGDSNSTNATVQNPVHTYSSAGIFTVNLTVTGPGGSTNVVKSGLITVTGSGADLYVSSISPILAATTNTITATIKNGGTIDAGTFKADFNLNGTTTEFTIDGLAAGSTTNISITDPQTSRKYGDLVPINITLDTGDTVSETDKTNNTYSVNAQVEPNGIYYFGGRYYYGYDLETQNYTEGHVALIYSTGNSGYQTNGGWYSTTVQYTNTDLPVPSDATIKVARLYQSYTFNDYGNPDFTLQFNGNTVPQSAFYGDGTDNYNGQAVYDVTPYFNPDGNTAIITATKPDGGLYGAVLVAIYEKTSEPYREIWLDEGCDSLFIPSWSTYSEYLFNGFAMFRNVSNASVGSAKLTTILPSGADNSQSTILFNNRSVYLVGTGGSDPSYKYYDVTGVLQNGTNELGIINDGYMNLAATFLEITLESPPETSFTGTPVSGTAPHTVQFTDTSIGATSWLWDFGDGDTTNATLQNPVHTYTSAGTYTVNFTATNAYGSNSSTRTGYITVTSASSTGPVVSFGTDKTSGDFPLTIQFTGTADGTVTGWNWDFGDSSTTNATLQNPVHTYTSAGTYSVNLTVNGDSGTNSTVKTDYITVNIVSASSLPLTTEQTGTVSGDLYVGSFQPVPFASQPTSGVTSRDFDQSFTIPNFTSIQWAKVYVNVYSGSGSADWPTSTTVTLDGNGDGTYETILGVENMTSGSSYSTDGTVYWINDHMNRVYSDYETSYNVTNLISSTTPAVHVKNEQTGSGNYDGRLKAVTLVVAYNDGDSDQVRYWVNHGHDWINSDSSSTTFATTGITTGFTNATLSNVALSSKDGVYTFGPSSASLTSANPVSPINYFENHTWSVTDAVTPGSNSVFTYALGSGSFKTTLATLAVKYTGATAIAPVASFTASNTSGTVPLVVAFTDSSSNSPTSWNWSFGDGNTSTIQNPVYTYATAGNYTVSLTAANSAGSDTTEQADYIAVTTSVEPTVTVTPTPTTTATNNLNITGTIVPVPAYLFAKEPNLIRINSIKNTGTDTLTNITVAFYANDVSETTPVNSTIISSLASGATSTITFIDPTIRSTDNGTVKYTAVLDPDNSISETNETDNSKSSSVYTVRYNGYKGKRYWEGGSDIATKSTYDLNGGVITSTQSASAYKGVGWTTRTESWLSSDLAIPTGATVEKAILYISYNWDTTTGGYPNWTGSFNGNTLEGETPYTDKSNFGTYGNNVYGLYSYNVTDTFSSSGNTLIMTPGADNSNALYPSTLVVIYRDANETRKQIFVNEECDELLFGESTYATNLSEATAYAPFSGQTIDTASVTNATLYSFLGSAGPGEGNLLFNGNTIGTNYWQGTSSTANASVTDVKSYLASTGNYAAIQSTDAGGMLAIQQILVVEYNQSSTVTAPVAGFTASNTSGTVPLVVAFTDTSSNTPTAWNWSFGDGTYSEEQNVTHTYTTAGSYNVTLTVSNSAGSALAENTSFITVTSGETPADDYPDLIISGVTINAGGSNGYLFANETNNLTVIVANNGTAVSAASIVSVDVSGATYTATIGSLAAGSNQSATITDTTIRSGGSSVTITATADSTANVTESNETNNVYTSSQTVYNNGYKGKRYTGGSDITTRETITGTNTLEYSPGSSAYVGSGWTTPRTITWTTSDLPVPEGSTIVTARLYQPYNSDQTPGGYPNWSATFNGNSVTPETTYLDRKSYGSYNNPYGVNVYNVTSDFSTSGNTFALSPGSNNVNALYGGYLVVIYRNSSATQKTLYLNEEADLLLTGTSYSVSSEEATAYAPFTGVDTVNLTGARLIAIAASAGKKGAGNSSFLFNSQSFGDFASGYQSGPQVSLLETDVTSAVVAGDNVAGFRSSGTSPDTVLAATAILVTEYTATPTIEAPAAIFATDVNSGTAPLTVQFTDRSDNTPTSWLWEFGDGTNATTQNATHTYSVAGSYNVTLTVSNNAGSNSNTVTDCITVTAAATSPVAGFIVTATNGLAPVSATFTDTSTNTPTSWIWEYRLADNGSWTQFSTEQNPGYDFSTAGTYDIRLTAANAAGNATVTKTHAVAAANVRDLLSTVETGTVSGDLYVNSVSPWVNATSQVFVLPDATIGNITWARLYVDTYGGSISGAFGGVQTVQLDGTTLGTETLNVPATSNSYAYPANDHVMKVSSDYEATYDVTSRITQATPVVSVSSTPISGLTLDNRIKGITLVVAYNDGDSDQVNYIVNHGSNWIGPRGETNSTSFDASAISSGWTNVNLTTVAHSSGDAIYTFNGNNINSTRTSLASSTYLKFNRWNITDALNDGSTNTLDFTATGSSFKATLAAITVRYAAVTPTPTPTQTPAVEAPYAIFASDVNSGTAPLTVNFTDRSDNNPTSWNWSFGDGTYSEEQNVTHTYTTAGNYTVNLTVTNSAGSDSNTVTDCITVRAAATPTPTVTPTANETVTPMVTPTATPSVVVPVASFTANKTEGDQPLTVKFTDKSTNSPATWAWDFGDGNVSADQNPVHTYSSAGTYTVILNASNSAGYNLVTKSGYITVVAPVVQNNGFSVTNVTTTTNGSAQEVSIDTTGGNITSSGHTVTINSTGSWSSLAITMENEVDTNSTVVNGTVASVTAVTEPVTATIASAGNTSVQIQLNMTEMPGSTAAITQTITKDPSSTAQSAFSVAATNAGKQIDDIAYTLNVVKTNLANSGDGGIIQSATLTFTVSSSWVSAHNGTGNIVILRMADDGTTQILTPTVTGPDASGNYVLTVVSPNGLSTFSVASVSATTTTTSSGDSIDSSSSGNGGGWTSSLSPTESDTHIASISTSFTSISSGESTTIPVNQGISSAEPFGISSVKITASAAIPGSDLIVADGNSVDTGGLDGRPIAGITQIEPSGVNPSAIKSAIITFGVSKSWLTANNLATSDVVLARNHEGTWTDLPTEFSYQSGDVCYFTATTPGFSYFAVTKTSAVGITTPTETASGAVGSAPTVSATVASVTAKSTAVQAAVSAQTTAAPAISSTKSGGLPLMTIVVASAVAIIAVAGIVLGRRWWIRRQNPALFREYR